MKERELKDVEESKLVVKRVVDEWVDESGIKHRKFSEELINEPLNLGSLKKPKNTNIFDITWFVPSKQRKDFGNFLGGFFK